MCEPVKSSAIIFLLGKDYQKPKGKKRPKETLRRLQLAYATQKKGK